MSDITKIRGKRNVYIWIVAPQMMESTSDGIEVMKRELSNLGDADDVVQATEEFESLVDQFVHDADVKLNRLLPVWHAVDRWKFGMTDRGGIKRALAKYREEEQEKR